MADQPKDNEGKFNVFIIGSGGREHALAWKAALSPLVTEVYVAPGNAGTALETNVENVNIDVDDIMALVKFAQQNNIGLVIIGPEKPLYMGITDAFSAVGIPCFGPNKEAAQIEESKRFAKEFLNRHNIRTAAWKHFMDFVPAERYIEQQGGDVVIKACGPAGGKGVLVPTSTEEAICFTWAILETGMYNEGGGGVVIEKRLSGTEASFIAMVDGTDVLSMVTSQDYKAAYNGDDGPNTGGMGVRSPSPIIDDVMHKRIMDEVIMPTVRGLADDYISYRGFLYAGLMIGDNAEIDVLEYNARGGDPETQAIMMRLKSDFVELCLAAVDGRLGDMEAQWDERPVVGVVMATDNYPEDPKKGDVITGLNTPFGDNMKVFHAGTEEKKGKIVTSGGRVFCIGALGDTSAEARRDAYAAAGCISWDGRWYRDDIAR